MNNPESATPVQLLLAEQLDASWLEERAATIASWKDSPHKRFMAATHDIDWAIATKSPQRMDMGFGGLHELATESEYDITTPAYRGAAMTLAYERVLRHRLETEPLGRKTMNATYRNWTSVGQEIGDADFQNDPGRPLSSLSEIILLGVHMRAKDPASFPYIALPREEWFEGGTFVNHDGYVIKRGEGGALTKEAWGVVTHEAKKAGTHRDVREVAVLNLVSGVLKNFPEASRAFRSLKDHMAIKLAQLRLVAGLLDADSNNRLRGSDVHILDRITGGLLSLTNNEPYRTTTRDVTPIESDLARQLRAKFGDFMG